MARIEPTDMEDLAIHRNPGCQQKAQALVAPELATVPTTGTPRSHNHLTGELRKLQAIIQGKDPSAASGRPKRLSTRFSTQMQVAAKIIETMEEDGSASVVARSTLRLEKERDAVTVAEKGVIASQEPDLVCELRPICLRLHMPMEDVLLGRTVFSTFDQDSDGTLDVQEFEAASLQLLRAQDMFQEGVASRLSEVSKQLSSQWASGGMSLEAFLTWYSRGVHEGLLATESQRVTELAALCGASADYVFKLKRSFDACCTEPSGLITVDDFAKLLQRVLRVPPQLEFPASRARHLWKELRGQSGGGVGFEDFLRWWVRYYGEDTPGSQAPFEVFYSSVRRVGKEHLDPPVPATPVELEAEEQGSVMDIFSRIGRRATM